MEGTARVVGDFLKGALTSSWPARLGGLLARPALRRMKRRIDWREVGGAPLVGVAGMGFITHGSSDALAMENAVLRARAAAGTHFTDEIAQAVAPAAELLVSVDAIPTEAPPPARRAAPADA
jgi:glycerol-3-phosphate acyltransferase PlsX